MKSAKLTRFTQIAAALVGTVFLVLAFQLLADNIATLRNDTKVADLPKAKPMAKMINDDIKRARNYPMQPPIIPHKIRGYEITLQVNQCLACHKRSRAEESQATMVSVTHYMDRDGNFLAEISPRRYFCNQCHVPISDARPPVANEFKDMEKLISEKIKAGD